MIIHIHTSPFTFTPHQPKGRATARPFGDRARFRPRSQSRDMIIHVHTSPFTFTPHQPKGRVATRPFGDRARFRPRSQSRSKYRGLRERSRLGPARLRPV